MLLGLQVWTCLENSFWSTWCNNTALCVFFNPVLSKESHSIFNRSWRISTTPNTTKFFLIIFKLIQQSIMVILSCLTKKNQNLNSWKKSSVYYWKLRFQGRNACKLPFLVINWTFFPRIQILIFLCQTTQNDHNRLLYKLENCQKKFWLCWELWIYASFC